MIATDPDTFVLHPHYAAHPYVRVAADRIHPDLMRARLRAGWRAAAPKRWLRDWDAAQGRGRWRAPPKKRRC
ncbi:MAG: hypothetical protein ACK4GO_18165 [Gemmobacter sp.]